MCGNSLHQTSAAGNVPAGAPDGRTDLFDARQIAAHIAREPASVGRKALYRPERKECERDATHDEKNRRLNEKMPLVCPHAYELCNEPHNSNSIQQVEYSSG